MSAQNIADISIEQPKAEDLLENPNWGNGPEFLMEPKLERPSQKPVFNIMLKETMRKELILHSDELELKLAISHKKTERKDPEKICANNLKLVYKLITTEKQPDMKTSEIKSFMEQNCWSLSMENPYISVYEHTNSLKGNPKLIENAKIQLTVLLFGIRKQCLMRQRQSVYYSENWCKFKPVEYSKRHLLELLLDKKNIRWKHNYEAKEFNHLV